MLKKLSSVSSVLRMGKCKASEPLNIVMQWYYFVTTCFNLNEIYNNKQLEVSRVDNHPHNKVDFNESLSIIKLIILLQLMYIPNDVQ